MYWQSQMQEQALRLSTRSLQLFIGSLLLTNHHHCLHPPPPNHLQALVLISKYKSMSGPEPFASLEALQVFAGILVTVACISVSHAVSSNPGAIVARWNAAWFSAVPVRRSKFGRRGMGKGSANLFRITANLAVGTWPTRSQKDLNTVHT